MLIIFILYSSQLEEKKKATSMPKIIEHEMLERQLEMETQKVFRTALGLLFKQTLGKEDGYENRGISFAFTPAEKLLNLW